MTLSSLLCYWAADVVEMGIVNNRSLSSDVFNLTVFDQDETLSKGELCRLRQEMSSATTKCIAFLGTLQNGISRY